jgi:hypothetical protein
VSNEARLHVGDVGTDVVLTAKDENDAVIDLGTSEALVISLEKPNGVVIEKAAAFFNGGDGSDGKFSCATAAGDLDVAGEWYVQGRVEFATATWRSQRHKVRVYENNSAP